MKSHLLSLFLLIFPLLVRGQGDFKPELKKLTDDLTQQIRKKGNKRLIVADFKDQQGNVTELGKYLAQLIESYLIRSELDVLNRSRIPELVNENKLSSTDILNPKNRAALGNVEGIQLIISGSTTPNDRTIELVLTAVDIERGSGVASVDGAIARTSTLNDLMRSTVKEGGGNGALQETPFIPSANLTNQNIAYTLLGDKSLDLPKATCITGGYTRGQVCFENILKRGIVLYYAYNGNYGFSQPNILIGPNSRNCGPILNTGPSGKIENANYEFYFHTTEEEEGERRYGKVAVVVEGCKVLVRMINSDRLFLSKTKP